MRRWLARLCVLLAIAMLPVPSARAAQPSGSVPRIGFLTATPLTSPETQASRDAFLRGLREHGYVEGRDIVVEYRTADARIERLAGLAIELVGLKVDLIVATATPAVRAAQQATTTIPIVGMNMGDPVRDGLVASLARPGGNITGTTFLGPELIAKRFELAKEALATVSRVALLWHPGAFSEQTMRGMLKEADASARALGLHLRFVEVRGPEELDRAFSTLARERTDAVFVFPSTLLFSERQRVVALGARHRVPLLCNAREFAQLGAFMSYGASIAEGARRTASFVDKILKGARPSDLPVEQPTTFELVINLKTARALGITVPPALLLRADQVIDK